MREWTKAQRSAIEADNQDILVSAAAGSGKTSVLIERIMAKLRGGMPIDRLLVITFTRAAAGEMRDRLDTAIAKEASSSAHMRRQYGKISNADISTLHTFCNKIIKRYFQAADVDPLSRVDNGGETTALKERALDEVMDALYTAPGEDGAQLIRQFEDEQILDMARALYAFLMAQDDPWTWLNSHLTAPDEHSLFNHPWYHIALSEALLKLQGAEQLLADCLAIARLPDGPSRYEPNALADLELVRTILNELNETGRLPRGANPRFDALSRKRAADNESPELQEQFKHKRDAAKAAVLEACALLPQEGEQAQAAVQGMAYTLPALRALADLVKKMHDRYAELKRARLLLDYNDLEHLALRALNHPLVLEDAAKVFDAVFVDEYQDISRIQEAIIQKIRSKADLFMVGDVKQSIYRFRLADPGLFLEKFDRFSRNADAAERLIVLRENFRSRENILNAVNLVFRGAMRSAVTEIAYDEEAALRAGKPSAGDPPVELHLIAPDEEASADSPPEEDRLDAENEEQDDALPEKAHVTEARLIARRIAELTDASLSDSGPGKRLQYRDIVILMRSVSGRAGAMARTLQSYGIPVYSDADAQYFDISEVNDILNILRVLDNPLQDVPLMSALSSPCFGFTPLELAEIRLSAPDQEIPFYEAFFSLVDRDAKVTEANRRLNEWRFRAQTGPLEGFLRYLIRDTGLYTRAGALPGGELRRANLRLLCERAASLGPEASLQTFLARVHDARRQDTSLAAAALGANENVVRIMTIHKSKGLEFPVVFMPDIARAFRMADRGELLLCDAAHGLALRVRDVDRRMTYLSFAGKALMHARNRGIRSEEARLLYVGMTRAQDRLILIGSPKSLRAAERQWSLPQGDYAAGSARCMLDWVGNSLYPSLKERQNGLYSPPGGSEWQIAWYLDPSALPTAAPEAPPVQVAWPTTPPSDAMKAMMEAPLRSNAAPLMKASVTSLLLWSPDGENEVETPAMKRRMLQLNTPFPPLPDLDAPQRRLTRAERGSAIHKALGAIDLTLLKGLAGEQLRDAIVKNLDWLLSQNILTKEEHAAAEPEGLAAFLESSLGKRLLNAQAPQREWSFTLLVERNLLLQGVIDCCFLEDGAWVVLDYKTDRDDLPGILHKYRDQMRWYMRALRDITPYPVKEAWLYSLHLGQPVRVTEENPITVGETKPINPSPHWDRLIGTRAD